ncbi:MAG: ABC transporter permease [Candidatus Hydrothermarchaeota archaeon]
MVVEILEGLKSALELIVSGDPVVVKIALRSIYVSGMATLLSSTWSIPIGMLVGMKAFKGRRIVKGFFNALLGMPTVALGLILYIFLSKSGPFGFLNLLYTPEGIIIGQAILITPIMVSFSISAIESIEPEIMELARTLGASEIYASLTVLREAISGVILSIIASFNRAIAELGIALMVGGNIRGKTRVLTTAIALETTRGEIVLGIALTVILITFVFGLSLAINLVQRVDIGKYR